MFAKVNLPFYGTQNHCKLKTTRLSYLFSSISSKAGSKESLFLSSYIKNRDFYLDFCSHALKSRAFFLLLVQCLFSTTRNPESHTFNNTNNVLILVSFSLFFFKFVSQR